MATLLLAGCASAGPESSASLPTGSVPGSTTSIPSAQPPSTQPPTTQPPTLPGPTPTSDPWTPTVDVVAKGLTQKQIDELGCGGQIDEKCIIPRDLPPCRPRFRACLDVAVDPNHASNVIVRLRDQTEEQEVCAGATRHLCDTVSLPAKTATKLLQAIPLPSGTVSPTPSVAPSPDGTTSPSPTSSTPDTGPATPTPAPEPEPGPTNDDHPDPNQDATTGE
jgi:hypothetical protein